MLDHFRPARRKLGVVTLAIACLITTAWVRSRNTLDVFAITHAGGEHYFFSDEFELWWETDELSQELPSAQCTRIGLNWYFQSSSNSSMHLESPDFEFAANPDVVLTFVGFYYGALYSTNEQRNTVKSIWIVPYWSIVLPLTLLSAWLLLSNPRAKPGPTQI